MLTLLLISLFSQQPPSTPGPQLVSGLIVRTALVKETILYEKIGDSPAKSKVSEWLEVDLKDKTGKVHKLKLLKGFAGAYRITDEIRVPLKKNAILFEDVKVNCVARAFQKMGMWDTLLVQSN
jgi:hypothetical protein